MGRRGWLGLALTLAALLSQGCAVGRYFYDRGRDLTDCVRVEAGLGPGIGFQVKGAGILDAGLAVASTPRGSAFAWNYGRGHIAGQGDGYPGSGWDNTVDGTIVVEAVSAAIVAGSVAGGVAMARELGPNSGELVGYTAGAGVAVGLAPIILIGEHRDSTTGSRTTPGPTLAWESYATDRPDVSWRRADKHTQGFLPAYWTWVRPDDPERLHGGWLWGGHAARTNHRAHVHAFDVEASVWAGVAYGRVGFSLGEFADFVTGWFGADLARDDWGRR